MCCYTYLIGWSGENKWYYGVRYSDRADPTDLWEKYFTSSKSVAQQRKTYGEPDIVQVRKIFYDDKTAAKRWEEKVLRRIRAVDNPKWLNISNNNSFRNIAAPWNKNLTKHNNPIVREIGRKISATIRSKPKRVYKKRCITEQQKYNDSWKQLKRNNPSFQFNSYEDFICFCVDEYDKGVGIFSIAKKLNIDGGTVKRAVLRRKPTVSVDQSWTKIKKRHPNFICQSYEEFQEQCKKLFLEGWSIYKISKYFVLNESTIKRAINHQKT